MAKRGKRRNSARLDSRQRARLSSDVDFLSDLPDEILLMVVVRLEDAASFRRLGQTCRRLRRIIADPLLQDAAMTAFAVYIRRKNMHGTALPNGMLHGVATFIQFKGIPQVVEERMYRKGRRHGLSIERCETGNFAYRSTQWQNGMRTGMVNERWRHDHLTITTWLHHGRLHGPSVSIYSHGERNIRLTAAFTDNKLDSISVERTKLATGSPLITINPQSDPGWEGLLTRTNGSRVTFHMTAPYGDSPRYLLATFLRMCLCGSFRAYRADGGESIAAEFGRLNDGSTMDPFHTTLSLRNGKKIQATPRELRLFDANGSVAVHCRHGGLRVDFTERHDFLLRFIVPLHAKIGEFMEEFDAENPGDV